MSLIDILCKTIEERKTIEFIYRKPGKVEGTRIGNPHALYSHPTTDNLTVDIYQIDGVSDTKVEIPDWRPFLLEYIENVKILDKQFEIAEGYESNPTSGKYTKIICKVK